MQAAFSGRSSKTAGLELDPWWGQAPREKFQTLHRVPMKGQAGLCRKIVNPVESAYRQVELSATKRGFRLLPLSEPM